MKNLGQSILLCLQFFSAVPIRQQLPLTKKSVTTMYSLMPLLSLLTGSVATIILFMNDYYFHFSNLLMAIILCISMLIVTGGIHMDGFIDTSDAFFSYQDTKKRLTILEDPHVGAFGVLAVVSMLIIKIGFLYEALERSVPLYFFFVLPFIARLAMLYYFATMTSARETGLAFYFEERTNKRTVLMMLFVYIIFLCLCAAYWQAGLIMMFIIVMMVYVTYYRHWSMKNFTGMTGDLLGALYEGGELILWGTLLLFI